MGEVEARLKGARRRVKLRDPRRVLLLDVATLGVYGAYWYGRVNSDLAALGRARDQPELGEDPARSMLALVPGIALVVPAAVSMRNTAQRIKSAQRAAGIGEDECINTAAGTVLLGIVPPVGSWYYQRHLNAVWERETEELAS